MEKIFETGTRLRLRFTTTKGDVSIEDLWDMPLTAVGVNNKFDLDNLALSLENELGTTATKSFVKKTVNKNGIIQLKFDIVKYIIEVKLAEAEVAKNAKEKKAKKTKLLELLAQKRDDALGAMSEEDILKELESLEA